MSTGSLPEVVSDELSRTLVAISVLDGPSVVVWSSVVVSCPVIDDVSEVIASFTVVSCVRDVVTSIVSLSVAETEAPCDSV